jgi:hypothetical protein
MPDLNHTELRPMTFGRRNPHCAICGDLTGGPLGHDAGECRYRPDMTSQEVAGILPPAQRAPFWTVEALWQQMVADGHHLPNQRDWLAWSPTRQQWIAPNGITHASMVRDAGRFTPRQAIQVCAAHALDWADDEHPAAVVLMEPLPDGHGALPLDVLSHNVHTAVLQAVMLRKAARSYAAAADTTVGAL